MPSNSEDYLIFRDAETSVAVTDKRARNRKRNHYVIKISVIRMF